LYSLPGGSSEGQQITPCYDSSSKVGTGDFGSNVNYPKHANSSKKHSIGAETNIEENQFNETGFWNVQGQSQGGVKVPAREGS
jgi:hypothetical protein